VKQTVWTMQDNARIARDTWKMLFLGDSRAFENPGQFLNLSLDGYYLRRPFSVFDWAPGQASIIYKVLGRGTDHMTRLQPGIRLNVLCGLGNGFNLATGSQRPLLVGGGVGVPPLYRLCRELISQGRPVQVALGFGSADEIFLAEEFRALGAQVNVATMDGSAGMRGTALDACDFTRADFFHACGPTAMLKALCAEAGIPGEVSLEERMGCGFGACMGCTIMTRQGPQRVCKEGPVFSREVLGW
jgi:dihydroorotate dehydrogenase electron transfer subunit